MSKDKVIRVNDRIKIINPNFFKRCGYPLSLEDAFCHINNFDEQIRNLLESIINIESNTQYVKMVYNKYINQIKKGYAGAYLESVGFGGSTRQIETFELKDYKDRIFYVVDKKVVRTGKYTKDSYSGSYLSNQKAHTILELNEGTYQKDFLHSKVSMYVPLKIEVCNVEKVIDTEGTSDALFW